MIKDLIAQIKKDRPSEPIVQHMCPCKFCGQAVMVEVPECWLDVTQEENLIELGTENCDCDKAERYVSHKLRKESAIKVIVKQFGRGAGKNEVDQTVLDMMAGLVDLIVEYRISSATIDFGNGCKANIKITSKGTIKVTRKRTEEEAGEA